jgi:uncharacterized integral membrane protein
MMGADGGSVERAQLVSRTARGPAIDSRHLLLTVLLVLIGVSAVAGVTVALAIGEATIALIIGIIAGAFFSRVSC